MFSRYQKWLMGMTLLLFGFITLLSAQEDVTVDSRSKLGGWPSGAAVKGDYAYLGQSAYINVLDISGEEMMKAGGLEIDREPTQLFVYEDYLLVFNQFSDSSLQVIDISEPTEPELLTQFPLAGTWPVNVAINGNRVYHCADTLVTILDVSDPEAVTTLGTVTVKNAQCAMGNDSILLVGTKDNLFIFDITDPANPVETAAPATPEIKTITLSGNIAYLGYQEYPQIGLGIYDVTDPANPAEINYLKTAISQDGVTHYKNPEKIQLLDGKLYLAASSASLFVFDVSDPANAQQLGAIEFKTAGWPWPESMTIAWPNAWLGMANSSSPLVKIDISDPNAPMVADKFDAPKAIMAATTGGDTIYVASDERLWIYHANSATDPELLATDWGWPQLSQLAVCGSNLLATREDTLFVLDVSQPDNITLRGTYTARGFLRDLAVQGDYAYLVNHPNDVSELEVVNLTNPDNPVLESTYPLDAASQALFLTETHACIGITKNETEHGIVLLDVANPAELSQVGTAALQGAPACVWVADTLLLVGSNVPAEANARWYLNSFSIAVPGNPTNVDQRTGEGLIRELLVHENMVMASIDGTIDEMPELDKPVVLNLNKLMKPGGGDSITNAVLAVFMLHSLALRGELELPDSAGLMLGMWVAALGVFLFLLVLGSLCPSSMTFYGSMGMILLGVIFGAGSGVDQTLPVNVPAQYQLAQNYPNPFNPETTIEFTLHDACEVNLSVYDLLGREVATLVDEYRQTGTFKVNFKAHDLPSGMYVYQLKVGDSVLQKQMLVVK